MLVAWAGLHEAGLAAELVRRAATPRQGRPHQFLALEDDAQATAEAARAPARPGRQPAVHYRGTGGLGSEGAHSGVGPSGVPPSLAHTTALLIRAVLAVRPQVTAPLRGQALPTTASQLPRGAEGNPGRAVVGTVKGTVLAAHDGEERGKGKILAG